MVKKRRRNLHREIIDPAIEYLRNQGAHCQNYHSPRSMPPVLKGHPDLVVFWSGVTWFVEVKPSVHRKAPLNDNQCAWFWRFYPVFCATIRYVIATDYDDLLRRVNLESGYDISVPEWYHKKLLDWNENDK